MKNNKRTRKGRKRRASQRNVKSNVIAIKSSTFDSTIDMHPWMLIKFYAPWCGHCKKLQPVYSEVADALASERNPAKLGSVDATANQDIAKRFGVNSYPTLIPFRSGKAQEDYSGERTKEALLSFMRDGVGHQNTKPAKRHKPAGKDAGLTLDHEDEATAKAGEKLLFQLNMDTAGDLSKNDIKNQVLVCNDFSRSKSKALKKEMQIAAAMLKGTMLFLFMDSNDHSNSKILSRVGARSVADCPLLRVASMEKGFEIWKPKKSQKAAFTHDRTGFVKLVEAWRDKKLQKHLRSDPVPRHAPTGPVKHIVGDMVPEYVIEPSNDVVLYLYMDGCPYCKSFSKVYLEVASEVAAMDDMDISFVQMNGPRNDIDHEDVIGSSYPRVYMFADEEKEEPIHFSPTSSDDPEENKKRFKTFLELYSTEDLDFDSDSATDHSKPSHDSSEL